jgi:heptosyltransferase-2
VSAAPGKLLIVAPNWLGDAVMALPLIADIRRAWPQATLAVAARGTVAVLFEMVSGINEVLTLRGGGGLSALAAMAANAKTLRAAACDAALLLPNSFLSAWTASRAGIPERWGFRSDARGPLLTRAFKRPKKGVHQAVYYQSLSGALGLTAGPLVARLTVDDASRARAAALLESVGVGAKIAFVAMAPGAAYGRAKQWPPARFAELVALLAAERQLRSVLIGSPADAAVCREIVTLAPAAIDLSGRTDLGTLAAVLSRAQAVVSNDSGAMHLAAAAGAPVVAVFGATNEQRTAPLRASVDGPDARVVATDVWCRPCMLRECPIDHRCMTGISAKRVAGEIC